MKALRLLTLLAPFLLFGARAAFATTASDGGISPFPPPYMQVIFKILAGLAFSGTVVGTLTIILLDPNFEAAVKLFLAGSAGAAMLLGVANATQVSEWIISNQTPIVTLGAPVLAGLLIGTLISAGLVGWIRLAKRL